VPFRKSVVREYFETIIIAVVLALFMRTFVVQAFKIPTGSMEPNLLIGDHLLVNKFVFAPTLSSAERAILPITGIRRGDIVVFKYPEDTERDFIKRVIGLPGETVEVRNCAVLIDGRVLNEPYLDPAVVTPTDCGGDYVLDGVVPDDHVFVMGDNRGGSQDSRVIGPISEDDLVGRAFVVFWPQSHWQWL
jgi:signal peptidase I